MTKLSLSFSSSRPLLLGWKLVHGAGPPIHSSQVIEMRQFKWKLSLSLKAIFSLFNSAENWYMVFGVSPPIHSSQIDWNQISLYKFKRVVENLQPPSSPRFLHPGNWPPSSPLLACRMALGRGNLHSRGGSSCHPISCRYLVLSTLTPPISFLLFISMGPLKLVMLTLSWSCLSKGSV